jgi:hypothetical protein
MNDDVVLTQPSSLSCVAWFQNVMIIKRRTVSKLYGWWYCFDTAVVCQLLFGFPDDE